SSDSVMPVKVAQDLGLSLSQEFDHSYSIETKEVPLVGRMKDEMMALVAYLEKI
ncbi:hypothetical protein KI387_002920, partial [Taxus chinensis]